MKEATPCSPSGQKKGRRPTSRTATGTFIGMESYQGNSCNPASLHKYTYARNNPQMYNDPSGHFIAALQMCMNSEFNSYLRNYHALNVIGMISSFVNATMNHLLGGEDDLMGAYIKGYIAGFVGGAMWQLNLSGVISVTESKGIMEVDIKRKGDKVVKKPALENIYHKRHLNRYPQEQEC